MHVDDLILVSIDDHVVEPPDMFDRHVPAKYRDRVPHIDHRRRRQREVGLRGSADRVDGSERGRQLAQGRVGLRPDRLRRDASGCVRHPRARARHEPQRHPRVDVLPDVRRLQRAACSRKPPTRTSRWPWCRPTTTGTSTSGAPPTPTASSPSPSRRSGIPQLVADEVRRVAAKGCPAITMPELPHIQGLPSYINLDYWDPFFRAVSEEQVVMCLHIGQGFNAITTRARRADRQPHHPRHAGVGARRAGPAVGRRVPHLPRPQGRVVGGRHRVDPLLPRPLRPSLHQPAVARSRLRRQDAERHLP